MTALRGTVSSARGAAACAVTRVHCSQHTRRGVCIALVGHRGRSCACDARRYELPQAPTISHDLPPPATISHHLPPSHSSSEAAAPLWARGSLRPFWRAAARSRCRSKLDLRWPTYLWSGRPWKAVEGRGKSVEGRGRPWQVSGRPWKAVQGRASQVEGRGKAVEGRGKSVEGHGRSVERRGRSACAGRHTLRAAA